MHTYQRNGEGWTVGYWRGERWERVREVKTERSAILLVNCLNGGQVHMPLPENQE